MDKNIEYDKKQMIERRKAKMLFLRAVAENKIRNQKVIKILLLLFRLLFTGWYRPRLPIHCDHY
jgi:hypothetical protein